MDLRSLPIALVALLGGVRSEALRSPSLVLPSTQSVKAPNNLSVIYTRPAVDHVVTYSFWRGFGPKGGDRVAIWRHGALVRQKTEYIASKRASDPSEVISYSNLATGASAAGTLRGPREASGFTFWRETPESRERYRYQLVKTSERRLIVGETCTVWRADPLGAPGSVWTGVAHRGCVTDDGVVLYEAWLYRDGKVAEERTAIEVSRRHVAPSEVLPPRTALNWQAWFARARRLPRMATGRPANYDLRLQRTSSAQTGQALEVVRHRASDGWERRDRLLDGKLDQLTLDHSSGSLGISLNTTSFSIRYNPAHSPKRLGFGEKATGDAPERVLGEECRWFNATVNFSDYSRFECRSTDGLPLMIKERSRGTVKPSLVAVAITRGRTRLRDLMPRSELLTWTAWGWPELDRR